MLRSRVLFCSCVVFLLTCAPASAEVGVATGGSHTLVVTDQGAVWAWGADASGQLGQGTTTTYRTVPVLVPISNVIAIAAGNNSSYALKADGSVWAWGYNGYGQLGNGGTSPSASPVQVSALSNVVAIAAGDSFALALKGDGTVWAWGANGSGQLGDGSTTQQNSPVQVTSLGTSVVAIAASTSHSHAVKADGTVWSWGYNANYELGNGGTAPSPSPIQTSNITGATKVRAAVFQGFALTPAPLLWSWGANSVGQLADGTTTNRSRPVQSTFADAIDIQGGGSHDVAIKTGGSVWSWGVNTNGQLGDGTTTQRIIPAQVAGVEAVAIATSSDFVVAVASDGRVWTWGRNTSGQLGDGTTWRRLSPTQISDPGFAWRVATPAFNWAPGNYTFTFNVTVTCATAGATIHYTTSGADPAETDPIVASGGTVAVTQNTTLKARAWKPGTGTSNTASAAYTLTPNAPSFSPGGGTYTTAKTVTVATSTAGAELRYTLDGSTPSSSSSLYTSALQISTATTLKAIALKSGWNDSAVTSTTYAFNYGTLTAPVLSPGPAEYPYGQEVAITAQSWATIHYTTDGSQVTGSSPIYISPVVLTGTRTISAKAFHPDWTASAVTTGTYTVRVGTPRFTPDAGTYAAGQRVTIEDDTFGAVIHFTTNGLDPTETDPVIVSGASIVACSCTIKARAFLAGWTTSDIKAAAYVLQGDVAPAMVRAGVDHSMVLKPDGTVWTWGYNAKGQLGDGSTTDKWVPTMVNALTGVVSIGAGDFFSLAVTTDGSVYAWGDNGAGQLGDTSPMQRTTPARVGTLTNITAVGAGASFSVAIAADGAVWTWGANDKGQLGDGTTTPHALPMQVPGIAGAQAVAAGEKHALVLRSDGTMLAWGNNDSYQLGDNSNITRLSPVAVSALTGVVAIGAGSHHTMAVRSDGTSWGWGLATYGRLGLGYDTSYAPVPTAIAVSAALSAVDGSSFRAYSIARSSDGVVWGWGENGTGQLGDGNPGTYKLTPESISTLVSVVAVAAGGSHTLAITSDGSVWAWGANGSGQVGDGTLLQRNEPTKVAEPGFAWKASTPRLIPGQNSYSAPTTVTLSAVTPGAAIYYTTNGVDPTTGDPALPSGGTFIVDRTLTLKAIAVKDGMPSSNVAAAAYIMNLPAPTFSPAAGTYASSMTVGLQCSVTAAGIRYTTDGTDPTPSSALYSAPVAIDVSTTIKARAFRDGWTDSSLVSAAYVLKVPGLALAPGTGTYSAGQAVTMTTATPGATIRYTLDGTEPGEASPAYTGPVTLAHTSAVKARAFKPGWTSSDSAAATYWVTEGQVATPVLSPAGGTYAAPVMVTMSCPTEGATIRYTIDGSEPTASSTRYRWPIVVASTATVKARAFKTDFGTSVVRVDTYDLAVAGAVASPTVRPPGGRFATSQRVTITVATPGATIRYTTNGNDPGGTDPVVPPEGTVDLMTSAPVDTAGAAKVFTFDANGNLTSDGTRTFEWDARNQLVAVNVGTHRNEFTYDGQQRRVRMVEKESGVTQSDAKVVWCVSEICEERAADGTTVTRRAFKHGEQVTGAARFFASDHLGSIGEVTDSMSALLARYAFDPWGRRAVTVGTDITNLGYTGHRWQSAGTLSLSLYRAYDSEIGRWLSEDPIGFGDGPNHYAYVHARVLAAGDPLGLSARIRCEIIHNKGIVTDIGLKMANARRCFLEVECPGRYHRTLEIYGPQPGFPNGTPMNQSFDAGRARNTTMRPVTDPCPQNCDFEDALIRSFNAQSQTLPPYNAMGPNSNTFVKNVVEGAGGTPRFPGGARGHDWEP